MNIKTFSIHTVRNAFALFIALGLGYVAYTVNPTSVAPIKVEATSSENVSGWIWSGGAGSGTADPGAGPYTAGSNPGVGWISLNDTNETTPYSGAPYGVNIAPLTGTGYFYGKAWSENVGWINFDQADTATCVTSYGGTRAQVNWATGDVSGWAHAYNGSGTSGWDGCIRLSGMTSEATPQPYGVKISLTTGKFSGYAWGDNVMGWIDFAPASAATTNPARGPAAITDCTVSGCTGGLACNPITKLCIPPNGSCVTSADCGGGQQCNPNGTCVYSGGSCSTSADCLSGESCNASGACVPPSGSCTSNAQCAGGQICNTTTSTCYDKPAPKFWQF